MQHVECPLARKQPGNACDNQMAHSVQPENENSMSGCRKQNPRFDLLEVGLPMVQNANSRSVPKWSKQ